MHTALTTKLSRAQLSLRSHVLIFLKYPKIIYIASSLKQKKKKTFEHLCYTQKHKATIEHLLHIHTQSNTCTSLLHTNLHLHISVTHKPTLAHLCYMQTHKHTLTSPCATYLEERRERLPHTNTVSTTCVSSCAS